MWVESQSIRSGYLEIAFPNGRAVWLQSVQQCTLRNATKNIFVLYLAERRRFCCVPNVYCCQNVRICFQVYYLICRTSCDANVLFIITNDRTLSVCSQCHRFSLFVLEGIFLDCLMICRSLCYIQIMNYLILCPEIFFYTNSCSLHVKFHFLDFLRLSDMRDIMLQRLLINVQFSEHLNQKNGFFV